jgi:hypothetical protein
MAWLIPGLGHILQRDYRRGLILFVVTQSVFILGMMFHGAVLWPPINEHDWGFNAMNILTFAVQLGNGLASLLCLAISNHFSEWAANARAHTLFELGSIYLLMAGAINSFTVGQLYDKFLRRGRPTPQRL